jgi:hypothetical protein
VLSSCDRWWYSSTLQREQTDQIQVEGWLKVQCVSEVKQALYLDLLVWNFTATTLYASAVLRMVSLIISDGSDSNWKSENFRKCLSIILLPQAILGWDRNAYFCLSTEILSNPIRIVSGFQHLNYQHEPISIHKDKRNNHANMYY